MVSANPWRPYRPPVKVSWTRPTAMPTRSPVRVLPERAWRATTTRKTSTTRGKSGERWDPTRWARSAAAMPSASLTAPDTGEGLLDRLGNGLVIQEVDLVERAEV